MPKHITLAMLAIASAVACGLCMIAAGLSTIKTGWAITRSDAYGIGIFFLACFCGLTFWTLRDIYRVKRGSKSDEEE